MYRRIVINPGDGFFKNPADYQPPVKKRRLPVNLLLFIVTVFTTITAGAFMSAQGNPFSSVSAFLSGLPFSVTILSILGIHEFAHYFSARYWGINVTLPYFIPAPILPLGTFGAVIKMKSSIPNRKALVDVGASGPIAGFIVAVFACVIGLNLSEVLSVDSQSAEAGFVLGESLLFKLLGVIVFGDIPDTAVIMLHPIAFAGWIGLFITALNLLPIGQLDGGHVLFALSPRAHTFFRQIRIPLLLLLGMTFWSGWYVWAALSLFFGRAHPYPDIMDARIGKLRTGIAVTAIIIFIICMMPTPIKVQ